MKKSIFKLAIIIFIYLSISMSCNGKYDGNYRDLNYPLSYILNPLKLVYSLGDTISFIVDIPKDITDKCKLNDNIKSADVHLFNKSSIYIYLNNEQNLSNESIVIQNDKNYTIKFDFLVKKNTVYNTYLLKDDINIKVLINDNSNTCNQKITLLTL